MKILISYIVLKVNTRRIYFGTSEKHWIHISVFTALITRKLINQLIEPLCAIVYKGNMEQEWTILMDDMLKCVIIL